MPKANLILAVLFLFTCDLGHSEEGKTKVGVILPLTGNAAEYGVAAKNGMILAQEDAPELFKNVQFIFEDSRHEARDALSALQSLQARDNVTVVISWGVGPTQVVAPITEKAAIPLVAITAEGAIAKGGSNVVRFNYSAEQYARHLMQYLSGCGYQKIGILTAEIPYFENIIKGMNDAAAPGQTIEVAATLQPAETDFRSMILALRGKHYDAIGVFLVTGQIAKFYQQAHQYKFHAPFFGTDFFESEAEVAGSGPAIEGSVYPSMNIDNGFVEKYVKRFGNDLQISYAGNAYDAAMLVVDALEKVKPSTDAQTLVSAMTDHSVHGVSGAYHFNNSGNAAGFEPTLVIKTIEGRKIKVASPNYCPTISQ